MKRNEKGQFVQNRHDITGQRFGRLVALEFSHKNKSRKTYWNFQCDCGTIKTIRTDTVKNGSVVSCGCFSKEKASNLYKTRKPSKYNSDGMSRHTLYHKWQGIKRRCYNRNDSHYSRYGGRGIEMCEEWLYSFQAFFNWSIENGWEEGLQIDRIDNDGNYEPSNCRYVTVKENCNNRSTTRKIEVYGEVHSITEWCEFFNLIPRYHYGKTDEELQELFMDLYVNTEVSA